MSRLGDTIRAARVAAKMSEKQLGKKCGMSESVIKDIEGGTAHRLRRAGPAHPKAVGGGQPGFHRAGGSRRAGGEAAPPAPALRAAPAPGEEGAGGSRSSRPWPSPTTPGGTPWGGVVKRVPVTGEDGLVIDHVLTPIVGGRIEGGAPDKVFYYRCPDDALRGYRIHAGDLLLTVPAQTVEDGAVMVLQYQGRRIARKVTKQEGNRLLLQSYDREFETQRIERKEALIIGRCVRLVRTL